MLRICGQAPRIQMPVNHKAYHKPHMLAGVGRGTCLFVMLQEMTESGCWE